MAREIIALLARRIGTGLAGFLASQGVDAELINQIVIGVTALILVTADLAVSMYVKRKEKS